MLIDTLPHGQHITFDQTYNQHLYYSLQMLYDHINTRCCQLNALRHERSRPLRIPGVGLPVRVPGAGARRFFQRMVTGVAWTGSTRTGRCASRACFGSASESGPLARPARRGSGRNRPATAMVLAAQDEVHLGRSASFVAGSAGLVSRRRNVRQPGGTEGDGEAPRAFQWTTFDLSSRLPRDWQRDAVAAATDADFGAFPRTLHLSREGEDVTHVYRGRVHADQVRQRLPWLYDLYLGYFADLANQACAEKVVPAPRPPVRPRAERPARHRDAVRVPCRFKSPDRACCSAPTTRRGGGELVFAHDPAAADVARSNGTARSSGRTRAT